MKLGLEGKSVVVTGGGSNIGRAIALAFAAEGVKLTIADLDETAAEKVAASARAGGAQEVAVVRTDVTKMDDAEEMARSVEKRFGSVDILVNNVGGTYDALFMEKKIEELVREVQINFWSVVNCTRAVLDGMVHNGRGAIVNIGSDAGRMGEYREAVYAGCKGGVIALTKSLAREVGRHGIRLNVVCPGTTMPVSDDELSDYSIWKSEALKAWNTDEMRSRIAKAYALRRVGRAGDIASAVVFLASDAASFITGQTLSVSGGYTMM